jgi:hypothetical protein
MGGFLVDVLFLTLHVNKKSKTALHREVGKQQALHESREGITAAEH